MSIKGERRLIETLEPTRHGPPTTHREQAFDAFWRQDTEQGRDLLAEQAFDTGYDAALALAAQLARTLDSVQQELAMARTPQAVSRSTGEEAAYYVSIRRRIRQALTHYHKVVDTG